MESLPANMFPTALADAPDLQDDANEAPVSTGFPAAPTPAAFKHAEAPSARHGTHIERAIGFLSANGPATREELAAHLGFASGAIKAYLGTAIKAGRIVVTGTSVMLADEDVPQPVEHVSPAPKSSKPNLRKTEIASLSVGELQYTLWASGGLSIREHDRNVELSIAQLSMLRTFLELAQAAQ